MFTLVSQDYLDPLATSFQITYGFASGFIVDPPTVVVPIEDDDVPEDDEYFDLSITVTFATGIDQSRAIADPDASRITIINDDGKNLQLTVMPSL